MTRPHLSKDGLAERLGVSTRTIDRKVERGEAPPFIRVGNEIRFPISGVEQWEQRHTFNSLAEEYARGGKAVAARQARAAAASAANVEKMKTAKKKAHKVAASRDKSSLKDDEL